MIVYSDQNNIFERCSKVEEFEKDNSEILNNYSLHDLMTQAKDISKFKKYPNLYSYIIGEGGFGKVFRLGPNTNGEFFALK